MFPLKTSYISRLISQFDKRVDCGNKNVDIVNIPRSPVPHLLKANRPALDEEKLKIQAVLPVAHKRAARLREKLEESSSSSNSTVWLQSFHALEETELFIRQHECILSVSRTLPNEILVSIFIACLPDVESEPIYRRKWRTVPSFRLSQVCRKWRSIVIHTPRMWTILGNIILNPDTAKNSRNSYLSFVKELLKRSGDMDLQIFITSTSRDYTQREHPVLALLVTHGHRWGALGIQGGFRTVKAICDAEPSATSALFFQRLRKLCLGISWGLSYDDTREMIDISRATLLAEATIPHVFYPCVSLPFKHLRIYKETFFRPYVRPTDMLSKAEKMGKKLEELEIVMDGNVFFSSHKHGAKAVTWENLKTLAISVDLAHYRYLSGLSSSSIEALLDIISLPNLETLKLAGFGTSYRSSTLISSIQHSLPHASLRKLHLRNLALSRGDLTKFLRLTINLEELVTDLPPEEDLDRLTSGRFKGTLRSIPLLVPRLRGLVLHLTANDVTSLLLKYLDGKKKSILILAPAIAEGKLTKDGKYFRLVLPDTQAAMKVQVDLITHNYDEEGHSSESVAMASDENAALRDKLLSFSLRLNQALRGIQEGKTRTAKMKTTTLRPKFASDLDQLLLEMEALKLEQGQEIANLYVTRLHLDLLSLFKAGGNYFHRDKKHMFQERANRILNKWDSAMLDDLKNRKINWALKGQRSLIYIGQDNILHTLPQIKNTMSDGMEESESEFTDIIWPDRF